MTEHRVYNQSLRGFDLARLLAPPRQHSRQSNKAGDKSASVTEPEGYYARQRFSESLHLIPESLRLRSRTESTRSSISSAHINDSATSYSVSTLASPLSSSYASDIQERFAAYSIDGSRACGRFRHGQQPSTATTCSTLVSDENDGSLDAAFQDVALKIRGHDDDSPRAEEEGDTPSVDSPFKGRFAAREESCSATEALEWSFRQQKPESASSTPQSDASSVASDVFSPDDADKVLDYALQVVYGMELRDTLAPADVLRALVCKFIDDVAQHIWQTPSEAHTTNTMVSSSSSTPLQFGSGDGSNFLGKRKKQAGGGGDDDEFSDDEGSGFASAKRAKQSLREEDTLRLSCPYRKRNPHRFYVRDHHSCAMTYFPKFAELRQHIVKQHKRDDPSAFICDRCTRDFGTRKELRDHQRQPKEQMCDISDHDPESSIDGPMAIKLVSRKRASGTSAEVQWREIWNILFPDDDQMIQTYCFTPVIEHFELSSQYLSSFHFLQASLLNKISNPATLETLATKFHQCFIEAVESCDTVARSMPYTNRSNKRNEPARAVSTHALNGRKPRPVVSRPDSGVVLDDGSEESGSLLGASALGHRDSVRTVVRGAAPGRPGSFPAFAGPREVLPAPAVPSVMEDDFAEPLCPLPRGAGPDRADAAALVQAWNKGVTYAHGDMGFAVASSWAAADGMTLQTDFAAMDDGLPYQTDLGSLGESYAGLLGER